MKKIKKIIAIFVLIFFVAQSTTVLISAQQDAEELPTTSPAENTELDISYEYNHEIKESCECKYVDGYPVMEMPPKTPEQLALIDEDPQPTMSFDSLPSQFSWKSYGGDWTTPAKDQASCGSCWAFSALAAMEAAINIASGSPTTDIDLSEQYILSCLSGAGSCSGGWMSTAVDYIQSTSPGSTGNGINGCTIESCMPYQAVDYIPCSDKCSDWDYFTSPPAEDNKLFQIESFGVTTTSEDNPSDWDLLKTWIMTYGPLSVDINANGFGSWGSSHHSPNDVYENDDYGTTNHGVLLCGWVDDPEILNGGYWIIKNSWGTGWGYGGFGNIAYGCNGVATRDCVWIKTTSWPYSEEGGGVPDADMAVFSDFDYRTNEGTKCPNPGEQIEFNDVSDGNVALREWDFDGDGVIDSTNKKPTWTYENEGEYEVTLTVHSGWGLHSNRTKIVEVKEVWPPIAVLPKEYTDDSLTYTFDGRYSYDPDEGTITDYHWDFGDGSTANEPSTTHTFPEPDKIYEVTLTVTDNEGATGSTTCQVKIDRNVPPVTEINHGIGSYNSEWYSETQRISFIATDWTEVIDTFYRIDGGEWKRYVPEDQEFIPVGAEGEHTIEAYSVDYYGNEETPVSETFSIDKSSPTLDVTVSGADQQNGWYTSSVKVELSGNDDLSGLNKIMYQIDFGTWQDYNSPINIGEGSHYVNTIAVDKAGNIMQKTEQIKVDLSAPKSTCILDGQGSDNKFYKNVEIRLAASDIGSGVKETYYKLDDAPQGFNIYNQPLTIDTLGEHTIEYYSEDNIGSIEQPKTKTFTISNVNFDLTISEPENALYIFGIKLLPIKQPILIGTGVITTTIQPYTQEPANIKEIDFLLDGTKQTTITESPYTWKIDQQIIGKHTIQITAHTTNDETITDQMTATFLIF